MSRAMSMTALLVAVALLAACTAVPPLADARAVELSSVPFIPQERWQCGPAALATVLQASGLATRAEDLVAAVWLPERQGAVTVELQAAARSAGRLAYRIDPDMGALLAELHAGRPVLVLQNLGIALYPSWHFAVVIAFDPGADELILRSGVEARHRVRRRTFEATWARGERWAMVVLGPGELPARVDRTRLLQAAADAERIGATRLALGTYEAWLEQMPEDRAARFGRAVAQAELGDLAAAAVDYEMLLLATPSDIAVLNNLALVRARQGCIDVARRLIAAAAAEARVPELQAELLQSAQEIERIAGDASIGNCVDGEARPAGADAVGPSEPGARAAPGSALRSS